MKWTKRDFPNNMPNLDQLSEAWDGSWLWKCFDHLPTPSHIPWWKNLWIFLVIGVQWANSGLWELLKKGSRVFVDAFVSLKFVTYKCLYIHFIVCYVHMFVYMLCVHGIHMCARVYTRIFMHVLYVYTRVCVYIMYTYTMASYFKICWPCLYG